MKTTRYLRFILGVATLALLCPSPAPGAQMSMDINLTTPKLNSLDIVGFGDFPHIHLQFQYDAKGKILLASGSGVATTDMSGTTTLTKSSTGGYKYTITAKGITAKTNSLTLKGTVGQSRISSLLYVSGKTKFTSTNLTVNLSYVAPVKASFTLISQMDAKGKITGTGKIVGGFGNDSTLTGTLKGSQSKSSLSWQLKQGSQQLTFTGKTQANQAVGTLTVSLPPEKSTFKNFIFPGFSTGSSGGGSGNLTFEGNVSRSSSQPGDLPSPAAGAKVVVRCDLNGNGIIETNEQATAVVDADGKYSFPAKIVDAGRAVIEVSDDGYARQLKVLDPVRLGTSLKNNFTMRSLTQMSITGTNATLSDGKLELKGLPATIQSVQARVFNPVTETEHFPGEFADDQRNMLVSSVFAAIDARDANGDAVTSLGSGSTLKLQVPKETWGTMRDLHAGNNQIDAPLYYFEETSGQWKRSNSDGWLEDGAGAKIPENQLTAIRNGTYAGSVYVAGIITHLSYWNCDWPIETHTCIQGVIVDANNLPVAGASVQIKGATYNGTTSPKITGADGSFCAEVMRSEGPGEDVDGNGTPGQTQQVTITVFAGTNYYKFGPLATPVAQGTCAQGNCLNLGQLKLSDASRLTLSLCTITGQFQYAGSGPAQPIAGAMVYGWDEEADPSTWYNSLTNGLGSFYTTTDTNGNFTLSVPVLTGVTIWATKSSTLGGGGQEFVWGSASLTGCPTTPVTLTGEWWRFAQIRNGTGVELGGVYQYQNSINVWLMDGSDYYTAELSASGSNGFPTQAGQSLTLDLDHISGAGTLGKVGTITFTATTSLGGTWQTTGTTSSLSGTWGN